MKLKLSFKEKTILRTKGALFPVIICGLGLFQMINYYMNDPAELIPIFGTGIFSCGLGWLIILQLIGNYKIATIKNGVLKQAKLVGKSKTMIRVNRKPLHELKYIYKTEKGRRLTFTKKTTTPNVHFKGELIPILYHTKSPKRHIDLYSLPQSVIDKVYHGEKVTS